MKGWLQSATLEAIPNPALANQRTWPELQVLPINFQQLKKAANAAFFYFIII